MIKMDGAGARRQFGQNFARFLIICSIFLLIGVAEALDSRWTEVTNITITNNSRTKRIKYFTQYNWSGKYIESYPTRIYRGESDYFVHASRYGGVDEAAIVYSDKEGTGWLLAWSVSGDESRGYNKVYVETKPIENYSFNVSWAHIKVLLYSSPYSVYYPDAANGNAMTAKITSFGSKAVVTANFKTLPKGSVYSSK